MWTIKEIEGVWLVVRPSESRGLFVLGRFDNKLAAVRMLNILNGGTGEFKAEYIMSEVELERTLRPWFGLSSDMPDGCRMADDDEVPQ